MSQVVLGQMRLLGPVTDDSLRPCREQPWMSQVVLDCTKDSCRCPRCLKLSLGLLWHMMAIPDNLPELNMHAVQLASNQCAILFFAVVLWCNVLGAFHWREDSLPWSGPSLPSQSFGEWTQIRQAKQCCMLRENVWCANTAPALETHNMYMHASTHTLHMHMHSQ